MTDNTHQHVESDTAPMIAEIWWKKRKKLSPGTGPVRMFIIVYSQNTQGQVWVVELKRFTGLLFMTILISMVNWRDRSLPSLCRRLWKTSTIKTPTKKHQFLLVPVWRWRWIDWERRKTKISCNKNEKLMKMEYLWHSLYFQNLIHFPPLQWKLTEPPFKCDKANELLLILIHKKKHFFRCKVWTNGSER